jgi:hypothetical protein
VEVLSAVAPVLAPDEGLLAPLPDFRYVGLEPGPRVRAAYVAGLLGAGATAGAAMAFGCPSRGLLLTAATAAVTTYALRRVGGGPRIERPSGAGAVPMAIVPWGVLIVNEESHRVLRWPAVERVDVDVIYGREGGTSSSLWSVVTVETAGERFMGRAPGAVPLDCLSVHVAAYAEEAAHVAALDLSGDEASEGPMEPEFEPLLAAAREYIVGAPASSRLDLPPGGYRQATARAASERTVAELRGVLRDRRSKRVDPRPFAAVIAAELHAAALAPELVELVQCPHPFIAAVAKAAARKLGVSNARVGALEEVAPFLPDRDVTALEDWATS